MVRLRPLIAGGLAAALLLPAGPAAAYRHRTAHPRLNELALERFAARCPSDPLLGKYELRTNVPLLHGETVLKDGSFDEGQPLGIVNGEADQGFRDWIVDGGRTADEPEIYSALRHFYDPKRVAGGKAYLTDHVNGFVEAVAGLAITDPLMDAREWAIDGPARNGYAANRYAWKRGLEYMERAFAETDPRRKEMLFARAWRSLGETMHLVSDMTVPAHVRNDAHPYDLYTTGFRLDPYEHFVVVDSPGKGDVITPASRNPVRPELLARIRDCRDVSLLFDVVADFTNTNYFSADTVAGVDPNTGKRVTNANGMPEYPSPRLDKAQLDPLGAYLVGGRPVAHLDWAGNTWWNVRNAGRQTLTSHLGWYKAIDSYQDVVIAQAQELVPVAVEASSKLVDWFVPRVAVSLDAYDEAKRTITGKVTHTLQPGGPYTAPLRFNKGPAAWSALMVNGRPGSELSGDYTLEIRDGSVTVKLGDAVALAPGSQPRARLRLFLGGFWVESADLALGAPARAPEVKLVPSYSEKALTGVKAEVSGGTPPFTYSWKVECQPDAEACHAATGSGPSIGLSIPARGQFMYRECVAVQVTVTVRDGKGARAVRTEPGLGCSPFQGE